MEETAQKGFTWEEIKEEEIEIPEELTVEYYNSILYKLDKWATLGGLVELFESSQLQIVIV